MEREQKEQVVAGTAFLFDVEREALVEKGRPENFILFSDMYYHGNSYTMNYSPELKNMPDIYSHGIPTITVEVPMMKDIDPEGMANKYGMNAADLEGKTDFDVVVDQGLYRDRMDLILPILDVMGHPFYMYIRERRLQPKDNFLSEGIKYRDIDYNESPSGNMWLFYDKVNQCNVELDLDNITTIPKHVFVLEIPTEKQLDPVGWAWKHGFDAKEILMEVRPKRHVEAKVIPWSETTIPERIAENRKRLKAESQSNGSEQKAKKKRGRKP